MTSGADLLFSPVWSGFPGNVFYQASPVPFTGDSGTTLDWVMTGFCILMVVSVGVALLWKFRRR